MFSFKPDECKIDPNFKGSIFEELGHSKYLCPKCNAHLAKDMICLNACHLPEHWQKRFAKKMSTNAEEAADED